MITPPFFAVQKQKKDGVVTLVAANYSLDANDLDPTADLALYVDTLTIPAQTFLLPSKNIIINARRITCTAGATLDTTGAGFDTVVLPMIPPTAANGSFSGDGGKDGLPGGATSDKIGKPGQNGGSVTVNAAAIAGNLVIKTLGGNGQKGQDGQNGGDGINGGDGNDAIIDRVEHDRRHPDGWVITPATPVVVAMQASPATAARAAMFVSTRLPRSPAARSFAPMVADSPVLWPRRETPAKSASPVRVGGSQWNATSAAISMKKSGN
jgi:hypothetical protein